MAAIYGGALSYLILRLCCGWFIRTGIHPAPDYTALCQLALTEHYALQLTSLTAEEDREEEGLWSCKYSCFCGSKS
jgi:hypothetical protein